MIVDRTKCNLHDQITNVILEFNKCKNKTVQITAGRMKTLSLRTANCKNVFLDDPFIYRDHNNVVVSIPSNEVESLLHEIKIYTLETK